MPLADNGGPHPYAASAAEFGAHGVVIFYVVRWTTSAARQFSSFIKDTSVI